MSHRQRYWTFSALAFVIFAALLGAVVVILLHSWYSEGQS